MMVMVASLSQSRAKSIVNLFNAVHYVKYVQLNYTLYAQNLCNAINDISVRNPNSFICCAEDFNLPDIDWDIESVS